MSRFTGLGLTEHPRVTALVMCDRIITEAETQKKSLIDLFTAVQPPALPVGLRVCLYVSLMRGTNEKDEVFVGLFSPSGKTIIQAGVQIHSWQTDQGEFDFPPQIIPLAEEGDYDLRVFVADAVLAQRTLTVRIAQPPPAEEQAGSPPPTPEPSPS